MWDEGDEYNHPLIVALTPLKQWG